MKSKKLISLLLVMCLCVGILAGCGSTSAPAASAASEAAASEAASAPATEGDAFPSKNISGIVQWGAGGGTDSLMRPLATLTEAILGVSIVVENKTGATGSIATQYVYDQAEDGYTLLMGAENPQLYSALDILDLTYAN